MLLEGTPDHIDVYNLCSKMEGLEGVTLIHDIHVWSIVPGYDALTAHILVDPEYPGGELEPLCRRLREIAVRDFGIQHITIQMERSPEGCTEHHHVGHLYARTGIQPYETSIPGVLAAARNLILLSKKGRSAPVFFQDSAASPAFSESPLCRGSNANSREWHSRLTDFPDSLFPYHRRRGGSRRPFLGR